MPTPKEIEDAIALRQKFKEQGLFRAIELMGPTERSYARRTICHALEEFAAPKVEEDLQAMALRIAKSAASASVLLAKEKNTLNNVGIAPELALAIELSKRHG